MCKETNKQVVTISDLIRAMTDEEWVKYFWELFPDEEFCTGVCRYNANEDVHDCDNCRLEWLKKPAEELHV